MRIFLMLTILVFCTPVYAQIDSARVDERLNQVEQQLQTLQEISSKTLKKYQELSKRDNSFQESISDLLIKNRDLSYRLDSLNDLLIENDKTLTNLRKQITEQNQQLSGQISETREINSQNVAELDKALDKNTLYWVIAIVIVGLLALLAFIFLKRRLSKNQSSVDERISNTRKELESEALKLDEKLIQLLETQLKVQGESQNEKSEEDHSLALKVADEIVRMQKNIARMEEDTKGIKPLKKGIDRIKDNFAANGYEMPDLLGEEYDERMNVEVINFATDENLPEGKRLISKIIKPQVNHNGELVQRAQVDVAQN